MLDSRSWFLIEHVEVGGFDGYRIAWYDNGTSSKVSESEPFATVAAARNFADEIQSYTRKSTKIIYNRWDVVHWAVKNEYWIEWYDSNEQAVMREGPWDKYEDAQNYGVQKYNDKTLASMNTPFIHPTIITTPPRVVDSFEDKWNELLSRFSVSTEA